MTRYLYAEDILPDVDIDYEHYARCERDVIAPALRTAGYELQGPWYTGDGDSFGRLTRCIRTDQGIFAYG